MVEVFSESFGPCKSILPTFKKLRLDGKDEEYVPALHNSSFVCAGPRPTCLRCACRQLAFLLIAAESCTQHEALREHAGKSEPLFLVYRVRNKLIHVPALP